MQPSSQASRVRIFLEISMVFFCEKLRQFITHLCLVAEDSVVWVQYSVRQGPMVQLKNE